MTETKTYELGYLVSPLVPADKIEEFASNLIGTMVEVSGGAVVSQFAPKMRALAYPVTRSINNKNTTFKDAYLGSVKFQAESSEIEKIKNVVDKNIEIIRYLLVVIPKGSDKVKAKKGLGRSPKVVKEGTKSEEQAADKAPMSPAEIDKEIEGLIADTEV